MKKTLIVLLALTISLSVILFLKTRGPSISEGKAVKSISNIKTTTGEDKIDITDHIVEEEEAIDDIQNGTDWLSAYDDTLPALAQTIDTSSIYSLWRMVRNIHTQIGGCNNYVTALKISLGLNSDINNPKMELLYQPVYLCRIPDNNNDDEDSYTVSFTTGDYYAYTKISNTWTFAPVGDIESLNRYKENIRIKRYLLPWSREFRHDNDETGDVKSMIFPFQEIDSVITHNHASHVLIWNYAFRSTLNMGIYTKHNLLLSPPLPLEVAQGSDKKLLNFRGIDFLLAGYRGSYANRSHLCPPSCDEVTYKIRH